MPALLRANRPEVGMEMTKEQERESAKVLRRAMENMRGDDYERSEATFRGMSEERLDQPFGRSGKTCRQIREEYRVRRARDIRAEALLEELLQARGL
jgi:hypothetical protein